jgi:hypothetical protein
MQMEVFLFILKGSNRASAHKRRLVHPSRRSSVETVAKRSLSARWPNWQGKEGAE